MSTAHRPTWTPAQAKATSTSSRQFSSRDMSAHTKLKFRQPGQGTQSEVARRDLRLELERAEKKGKNSKGTMEEAESLQDEEANQAAKRRKLLVEAAALDRDDSDEENDKAPATSKNGANGADGEAAAAGDQEGSDNDEDEEEDSDDSDSDDSEDETADLLRELEKIKRERAEEKERQEREAAATSEADREAAVALGNPLLNLQAAMSGNATPGGASTASSGSFGVKRRWDDDVIFKNQANDEKPRKEFVNDLLRTEFHKKFLKRFIA